jgi:Kdo2-lipid IVA lauroyltransferase/acyltransferase
MKPSLQHRGEYLLARALEGVLGRMPRSGAERAGEVLGSLVRRPLAIRREVVETNLRRAFPAADDAWIAATVAATYRHLGREVTAMLRLSALDRAAVRETVEIPPATRADLDAALAEGKGVILATGHYGNWEMAAAGVAARDIPLDAVVKRQSNRLVDARIQQARRALGVETIDMREAPRRIPRSLLTGRAIGIVADQDAGGSGVPVPFFGVPASAHRGPALFALRFGSPLFAAVARRLPDGHYLLDGERIDTSRTDSLEADVRRVTSALAAHLEGEIRKDPAQYFWLHKRWKTRLPEEHPSEVSGTKMHGGRGASAL